MSRSNNPQEETTPLLTQVLEPSPEDPRQESDANLIGNVNLLNRGLDSAICG